MRRLAVIVSVVFARLCIMCAGVAYAQQDAALGVPPDASARVEALDAGIPSPAGQVGDDAGRIWASCIEHVPEGAVRPKLTNTFPSRGLAGHALTLNIQVEHGRGETVLPHGFRIQSDTDAARAISNAGFMLPDPNGGSAPSLVRRDEADKAITEVQLHFLSLPSKPGRHELTLPPIPIAVSRASGEYLTICTTPHVVVIDEPIVDEPNPSPVGNPPPRPQREVWTLARDLTYGALVGAVVAALVVWLVVWWKRRPKRPVPPPPPRPPWEVALEALEKLRRGSLVLEGKRAEHVDRVSDIVRIYLGDRFGFDGIESTTEEVLHALRGIQLPDDVFGEVRALLQHSDLVKFARWSPTDHDCEQVLGTAEEIVRVTTPEAAPQQPTQQPTQQPAQQPTQQPAQQPAQQPTQQPPTQQPPTQQPTTQPEIKEVES